MVTTTLVAEIVGQFQQLLECSTACFLLECVDPELRHPVLNFLPTSAPIFPSGSRTWEIWQDERVRSVYDLAAQSGRVQVLHEDLARWHLRSLAAVPLDTPAGLLGVILLADERQGYFGAGEVRLLYASLSMCIAHLEPVLWEMALIQAQNRIAPAEQIQALPDELLRNETIALLGHELRAPLGVIKGYASLLQAYGKSDGADNPAQLTLERQHHFLDMMMWQIELLESLLNNLLDISRLQHGKLALQMTSVDVEELCQRVIQLGQLRADQRGAGMYRLVYRLADRLPPVRADASHLQQVLFNLLENALKYSPKGGDIELEVSLLAGESGQALLQDWQAGTTRVCFAIRDQGIGIPSSHIPRLFQPFERLERPANARIPGTGLGLYIVRTMVEAMHGTVEVQSREGNGTTVMLLLPVAESGKTGNLVEATGISCGPIG